MPAWQSVNRHLYRLRTAALPPNPKSPAEVIESFNLPAIIETYGMTIAAFGKESMPFFRKVHIDEDFAYAIFASQPIIDEVLKLDEERRHFYLDGTFKVVPYGQFSQLLVIYAEFFEKVYLLFSFFRFQSIERFFSFTRLHSFVHSFFFLLFRLSHSCSFS